ncbi:MAG: hypothetical protein J7M05_06165 [Anaerolineae bacterium]|nr:hypothetical protein [Anaerolineae bacterium]
MKGKYYLLYLHPQSSYRGHITAHTLFGAACWALAALGEDVGALLARFSEPGFAFTRPFPYVYRGESKWRLFPAPPYQARLSELEKLLSLGNITQVTDMAKKVKGLRYLSPGVMAECRQGRWRSIDLVTKALEGKLCFTQGALWLSEEVREIWPRQTWPEVPSLWQRVPLVRTAIDRSSGGVATGMLYTQEEVFIDRRCAGLWAGLWIAEGLEPKLWAALRYLEDSGIGGDRSTGRGHFTFSWEEWKDDPPTSEGDRFLNLSAYIPREGESEPLAYNLLSIRQKAENRMPLGGQRVYLAQLQAFAPGSLFQGKEQAVGQPVLGRLVKMGQVGGHSVYYHGLTIPLWGRWEAREDGG